MENQLDQSLQKTAFWMSAVGLVMSIFNIFAWCVISLFAARGFDNSLWRGICAVICLIISTYAGYAAIQAALHIKEYQIQRASLSLEKAFYYEAHFWTCLTLMVASAATLILLIVLIRI